MYLADAFGWHAHTNNVRFAISDQLRGFLRSKVCAATVIAWRFAIGHLLSAHGLKLFRGTKTAERMVIFYQLLGIFFINIAALALTIRGVRPTDIWTFCPVKTDPTQRIQNHLFRLLG